MSTATQTTSRYYRKINAPFLRDKKGVFLRTFSDPVFGWANDRERWAWYLKWDGTSVGFEVATGEVFGRTKDTQLTNEQWETVRAWRGDWMHRVLPRFDDPEDSFIQQFPKPDFVYGELIGPGIQGNKHKLDALRVEEFDWRTGADFYAAPDAPLFHASLQEVTDAYREGRVWPERFDRYFGIHDGKYIEGLIGRLTTSDGNEPIITKLKAKDRWSW